MGPLLSAVRQRALARGWPGFGFFQPRPSHQVSPPGSRGTEPLHWRRAGGLVLLWNTVRGESRPSGQQGTRVQDLPVRASVASSATVHRQGFQFSSNKEDFSSRRTQEDKREGKSLIPKTAAQPVCQRRVFARGAVVVTSHKVSSVDTFRIRV